MEYAFEYFSSPGIVTGGDYGEAKGCRPYTIPEEWPSYTITPACNRTCRAGYGKTYAQDIYTGWLLNSKSSVNC